jgi:hypothetical protein
MDAIKFINNPEIAPEVRQRNQEILLKEVGQAIYDKVYDMNAFDMEIPHTTGSGINDAHYGMAKVASNSVSTGQMPLDAYITNFLQQSAAKAQHDASRNAKQSGKHPTVVRKTVGKTCQWCNGLAGTYTNPTPDIFRRHSDCNCSISSEGYKSRNGELNQYSKGTPVTVYRGEGNNAAPGTDLFGQAHYVARDKSTAAQFGTVKAETLTINPNQIYTISSDAQYEALVRDAQRKYLGEDVQTAIPKLLKSRGFKAVEGTPEFDPLAGIAVLDPKLLTAAKK